MSAQPPPPILVLGTSERVGSNWVLDSLRHATVQHNEPLRQQLGREHPLAPMAAAPASGANSATGLAAYWVDVFQRSKYHGGQHLIKETNLYFTAASLLELFPDAPVVVLSRAPIGVAGSFARGGLWWRWGYAETYHRVGELAREQPDRRWVPLLPDEDPSAPVGLTRLIVLNAALLAEALRDRAHAHVSYESAVGDRQAAMAPVAHLLPDVDPVHVPDDRPKAAPAVDSTFATTRGKDRLIAYLPPETADAVASETKRCLDLVRCIAAPKTADTVERWLSGNDAYALAPAVAHVPPPRPSARRARIEPAYLSPSADGLRWRNLLVSNAEMAAFLNSLAAAGLANTRDGVRLLAVPMPHERGGRLHPIPQGWQVSPGYEHHPAYWVTWIGAAAYVLSEGARLPTSHELDALTAGARAANAEYRLGDVEEVQEPGLEQEAVHHQVGNLQVWCGDGPAGAPAWAPVTRYLHGAAWNTPASRQEITRRRGRHLLGASRGVGVRLVRDSSTGRGRSVEEIADRLNRWLTCVGEGQRPAAELDRQAVALLAAGL